MSADEAKDLIVDYARNQTDITNAANSRGRISKRLANEEKRLVARLLTALTDEVLLTEHVQDVINRTS